MSFPVTRWFKASEFKNPDMMNVAFVLWLDLVRDRAKVPFVITSDGRPGDDKLHGLGLAVDIDSSKWTVVQKWRVVESVMFYANQAPGKVEFETVFSPSDKHWHLAVDPRPGKSHEFVEADD